MKLYLQNIIEYNQLETLSSEWLDFDFVKFSNKKKLFDYQQQALKNAIKVLYKYYSDCQQDKQKFFHVYQNNDLHENLDLKINGNKRLKIFEEFSNDYQIKENKIKFQHFINRMSFWMATGSGKTLVIVKLLELLGKLIQNNQIPNNDILFLTCREDLIEQFKNHVAEFNDAGNSFVISLHSLKDYEKIKIGNQLKYTNIIDIFYYRSDLISDEQKDKIIDFRNYDNNGKWYILLDEAHKGDKEDSKRQHYYSILSRNGFLFNFSATYTELIDYATCGFNFNLEKFIQQGYGKHIYISQSNVAAIGQKDDFSDEQKQIIILKIFLLHTLIKKTKPQNFYHNPLILTLVNSVNTEDSDLHLFFNEIEKIAKGETSNDILQKSKIELKNDLNGQYEFENEKITFDIKVIDTITIQDIIENVFNSKTYGNIEVLKIPGNKQEIILKLKTSENPFALIKIGDISEWIKNKLLGYEINEKFDNESLFRKINNDDSNINILMGSRSFYEGWDSNRPNLILYINIGKGADAKKFVLQSIGRGVRIEPLPNKRKRILFLYNNNEIDKNTFEAIKDNAKLIETLFVYGTKAENLREIIDTLKKEKQDELIGDLFEINPEVKDKLLLIPVYKESDKILADENVKLKFEINDKDFTLMQYYYNFIGDKIALVKYDCQPKILKKIQESFENDSSFYKKDSSISTIGKPEILFRKIIQHFSLKSKEFHEFKPLENEIIHFKQIRISIEKLNKLREKIKKVKKFPEKIITESELKDKLKNNNIDIDTFTEQIKKLEHEYSNQINENSLHIKYIKNHYYIPLCLSEEEKISYINHIIKTKSEANFIKELEQYLNQENNFFKQFDWWFFSKIDETLDEVYIPYYQPKTNRIEKFKPDFIFWLKKGNSYTILFVDPKGTEHTDAYRKMDGFSRTFEAKDDKKQIINSYNGLTINVKLLLKTDQLANVPDNYKQYWFNNFDYFAENIK